MTNAADDHHSDNRLHVLSGALRAFAEATTDYERLVGVIARTVASVVADGCIVRVLSEGGWLAPVAYHLPLEARIADVEARARVHAFMSARRNVNEFAWGQHLVDSGEFFLLRHLEMQSFRGTVRSDVADVYETMGIHSMLVVALRLRGETIGTLSLFRYHVSSTAFDERDVDMAQALADHAALAMANARSYVSERRESHRPFRAPQRIRRRWHGSHRPGRQKDRRHQRRSAQHDRLRPR
jgi:transcriptional regulator with GAF, ATPase, and Fis domain